MKFVYTTDLHLYDRDISTRNDSSAETALTKLRFVVDTANSTGADYLLLGGDMFSERIDSPVYMASLIDILRHCAARILTVIGNHDVVHRTTDGYKKRNLVVLRAAGVLDILSDQLLPTLGILGISAYDEDIVDRIAGSALRVNAVFAHHSIEHGTDRLVLSVAQLKKYLPNLRYIFSGHDHTEYPDMTIEGVVVIRPGSLLRTSTALENVTRAPLIVTGETSANWSDLRYQKVIVPYQPATAIFNLDTKAVTKSTEQQLDEFASALSGASSGSTADGINIESIVLSMAQEMGDPDLLQYVREDLSNLLSA